MNRFLACPCGAVVSHCAEVRMACLAWGPEFTPGPGGFLVYAGQLSAYSEIIISGKNRGFNGVLFNLWPLANAGFTDAQY